MYICICLRRSIFRLYAFEMRHKCVTVSLNKLLLSSYHTGMMKRLCFSDSLVLVYNMS
jgi:hypothetical protein